jgi:hypothetical protein
VLVQHLIRTVCALVFHRTFRFGSAEAGPIGVRLFRRLFSLDSFPEPIEIDHLAHTRPRYRKQWAHVAYARNITAKRFPAFAERTPAGPVIIEKSRCFSFKKIVSIEHLAL